MFNKLNRGFIVEIVYLILFTLISISSVSAEIDDEFKPIAIKSVYDRVKPLLTKYGQQNPPNDRQKYFTASFLTSKPI
jgi:hypothetical protein